MNVLNRIARAALVAFAAVAVSLPALPHRPPGTRGASPDVPQAVFGERFPAWTYVNANEGAGGVAKIDLAATLGKTPVIFYFWAPGTIRSDSVLSDLQALVARQGPGKLVLYAIVSPLAVADVATVKTKARDLKLSAPVLWDESFRLMQQLHIMTTPCIAIVDRGGILRLSNGVSLKQPLEYKMTLEDGVKRVATTGQLGTYGELPRYDPVTELVGKKPPEFELPEATDGIPRRSTSLLSSDKLTVLVFWSIDCSHCVKFMPRLNGWLRNHREGMNVVSLAKMTNDAMKTKTAEFVKFNGFIFPTLLDKDFTVAQRYLVTSTPTIVVLRPDGIMDSVMPAGDEDFDAFFGAKRREILKKS